MNTAILEEAKIILNRIEAIKRSIALLSNAVGERSLHCVTLNWGITHYRFDSKQPHVSAMVKMELLRLKSLLKDQEERLKEL